MSSRLGIDTMILYDYDVVFATEKILQYSGVKGVEIAFEQLTEYERRGELSTCVAKLNEVLELYGGRVLQVHAPYGELTTEYASPDPSIREASIKRLMRWVDIARELGCEVLVVHTSVVARNYLQLPKELESKLAKLNVEGLKPIVKYAMDHGVKIAVENRLEPTFGYRIEHLKEIVEGVGTENIGICIDFGHANVRGVRIEDLFKAFGDRVFATHIHDNDGSSDQHLPIYMGSIRWSEVAEFVRRYYKGPLVAEVICKGKNMYKCLNWMRASASALKELFT